MKKILVIISNLILIVSVICAQSPGDTYAITSDFFTIKPYNTFTDSPVVDPAVDIVQARRGHIFTIQTNKITTADGKQGYYIIFFPFDKKNKQEEATAKSVSDRAKAREAGARGISYTVTTPSPPRNVYVGYNYNNVVFFISADDLKNNATTSFNKKRGLTRVDALVLPIKIRFKNSQPNGNFDFEQSISLGPAIGYTFNYGGPFGKSSSEVLLGFNITNISVDSNTAPKAVTSKTTLLGLTPFVGYTYTYSGISFSLLGGIDILTGNAEKAWVYRKSPWLGVSIGTSLFSSTPKTQSPVKE